MVYPRMRFQLKTKVSLLKRRGKSEISVKLTARNKNIHSPTTGSHEDTDSASPQNKGKSPTPSSVGKFTGHDSMVHSPITSLPKTKSASPLKKKGKSAKFKTNLSSPLKKKGKSATSLSPGRLTSHSRSVYPRTRSQLKTKISPVKRTGKSAIVSHDNPCSVVRSLFSGCSTSHQTFDVIAVQGDPKGVLLSITLIYI